MLKIQNMMDVKGVLLQWFINFLIKTTSSDSVNNENMSNQELAEELHIRKFEKQKVYLWFVDNIWGADLADMQLSNKFNKGICVLLCVINIYSKWVGYSFKRKKGYYNYQCFSKIFKWV